MERLDKSSLHPLVVASLLQVRPLLKGLYLFYSFIHFNVFLQTYWESNEE
jgi:hypothetical protein